MKKLALCMGLILVLMVHILVYGLVFGRLWTPLRAREVVTFKQEIMPVSPIATVDSAQRTETASVDKPVVKYEVLRNLETASGAVGGKLDSENVFGQVVTFSGKVPFPGAVVILEISSDGFITSTRSDSRGYWSWTNYGAPLEDGRHGIGIYAVAPYEVSGIKDVYVQQRAFLVDSSYTAEEMVFDVSDRHDKVESDNRNLSERFAGQSQDPVYGLDLSLVGPQEYYRGESLDLKFVFESLLTPSFEETDIVTQIYEYRKSSSKPAQRPIDTFVDRVNIGSGGSFLKRIFLKQENILPGMYILKAKAEIGGDTYLQQLIFEVRDREVVRVGSMVVEETHLQKILTWNALFLLAVVLFILALIAREYRRLMVYPPVGEKDRN